MNIEDLRSRLGDLSGTIDDSIEQLIKSATKAQDSIYDMLLQQVENFQIENGAFLKGQNYTQRLALIQRRITEILNETYTPSLKQYLGTYSTIEQTNISLQKSYNELVVDKELLTPARRSVYNQAEYYLSEALADAYVQPAKYLLMQQVTVGGSIQDAKRMLRNWNDGELSSGRLSSGRPTPRLQAYANQIATDTIHQYNGTINDIIRDEYKLTKFVYVGDIIKDSRPACRYMVGLRRKIDINEVPKILETYPEGVIPNTTRKNFFIYRGGYNCRHLAMAVKG